MKKIVFCSLLAAMIAWLPAMAFAASPWTEKATWGEKAKWKLDFGVKNLLGGWTEIINQPRKYHKENKNCFEGLGKGFLNAGADTGGGLLHILTFPATNLDIPLPDNGVNFS